MRFFTFSLLVTAVMLAVSGLWPLAVVAQDSKPVIGYGAFCRSAYGATARHLGINEAFEALKKQFSDKGFDVRLISHDRRFLQADVINGTEVVDRILLDTWTGRMRSVY